jgi:hypothetical protein
MLAAEVTPGLLAGAEPDAHQFNVTICLKGDQILRTTSCQLRNQTRHA